MRYICCLLLLTGIHGCKYDSSTSLTAFSSVDKQVSSSALATIHSEDYENGTYCATMRCYNPDTESNNICNLSVEVKNNKLVQINSCDCNWVNESQFVAAKLDETGSTIFKTSKNNQYTITLNDKTPLLSRKFQCDICGRDK